MQKKLSITSVHYKENPMTTAREKNTAHDQRQVTRPKAVHYDFTALAQVMKVWYNQEIYSPYSA